MAATQKQILIIDDDDGIRNILRRALETAGYEVREASDGAAGLKRFREQRPDLVMTDIIMPEREGVETIMALRKESPETAIIAMSGGGGGGADYLEMAIKLGAVRVFSKPFSLAAVLGAVREILEGVEDPEPPRPA
jgi:DNA-binding NtrC family response regulator